MALLVAFWFGHEPALVWGVGKAIDYFGPRLGLKLEIGSMRLHLFHPIEFRDLRFRVTNPKASRTDAVIRHVALGTNSLWQILFGNGRVFRELAVEGMG